MPPFLTYIRLLNVALPFGSVDLLFERHPLDVSVTVLRKHGDFDVRVVKRDVSDSQDGCAEPG